MLKPFQSKDDRITELERQLENAHELLDHRYKMQEELIAEIIDLGGSSPPWDVDYAKDLPF